MGVPAQTLQWGRYLVNSVTAAQLLPSEAEEGDGLQETFLLLLLALQQVLALEGSDAKIDGDRGPPSSPSWGGMG